MKRLILSTVCILLCATGSLAQTLIDGIYYNFDASTQTASVTNKSGGYSSSNSYLGSITIPSTVAYNGTSYSVTSIGTYAFYGCTGLTNITIPNSVTSIGNYAFYGCTGLTNITIPNSVTSIGRQAFSGCKGLTSLTIPNSVTSIGDHAFSSSGLTSINVAEDNLNYTSIDGVLYSKDKKTLITCCPGGKTGSITIPNSVTSIGDHAFADCSGLTSITIPNSVTSIGSGAFYGCKGLTSLTIPNSVTSIGSGAFNYCTGLTNIYVAEDNLNYTSIDGVLYSKDKKTFIKCPEGKTGSLTIPNSVTSIGDLAFSNCSGLTSVTIPNSVTSIGYSAFFRCTGLTSVTIPNSVTSIGVQAFYNCTGLTSVTIPNSVTSIGDLAFYNVKHIIYTGSATGSPWGAIAAVNGFVDGDFVFSDNTKTRLTAYIGNGGDVTIPNSVTSIGSSAFSGCTGLTSITIPNSVTSIGESAFSGCDNLVYNTSGNAKYLGNNTNPYLCLCTPISQDITSCEINENCKIIADKAFYRCSGLTNVTIPNSVTSIGYEAFRECGLTSITIPSSVTSIGGKAFRFCTALMNVTIGDGVKSIETYAFADCSGLTSITIPNSVTSIGDKAFSGCENIVTANINSQAALGAINFLKLLRGITLGDKITSIGERAFYNCDGLTSITIPNSVTSIGSSAFYDCDGLTSVTIPNSVTSIGNEAFRNCSGLKSITIPNSVTSVGDKALSGCSGLTSIIVPCGKYGYFTGIFTEYASIIHCASEIVTNVNNEKYGTVTGEGVYEYGTSITLTATANEHCHFVKWNDGNTENPRTVQVTQDGTFTAIFAIDEHNVILSKNISDAGTVTGDGVYEYGTNITLTATPNEGCSFKGWSDGVTDASREITVTKDTSITAIFVAYYKIKTLASASQGTIIGGGIYEHGEIATLVANAKPGYVFAQWADGNDENPRYVTVDGNKTYTAIFIEGEQDKYMITWKNWDGRVIKTSEVSYGEVPAFDGEKPTRPDEAGYTFTFNGWSPTIAAASQNAEYTANYIQTATEAEKTTIGDEGTVNITTTDNTALFTWPENASADTYTLTITRNDEVFCSLTFDGQGRLINLNFPNLRASAEGYQFTVTGLNSGTDYAYDLKAKNGAATVNEYTGEFRTSGDAATAAPEAEESIVETARYDINGRPLNAPTKGVNIVKYSDGSFEKEFVR